MIAGLNCLYAAPIHDAARTGDLEKIKSLVDSGIDPNDITGDNHSPLTVAASGNKLEAIDLLISLGADINLVSVNRTPLLAAIEYDNTEAAYKLILKGASLDHIKGTRTTPLIAACQRGYETVIDLILLKGVDINQKDMGGATAIHALAEWSEDFADKKLSILKKFVSEGANINEIASRYESFGPGGDSESFVTPLELAYKGDIMDFLIENGAKAAAQVLDDRLSTLEQKVEQGSSGNTNPTSEWPRKMWEIDFGRNLRNDHYEISAGKNNVILLRNVSFEGEHISKAYWITSKGIHYELPSNQMVRYFFPSIFIFLELFQQ